MVGSNLMKKGLMLVLMVVVAFTGLEGCKKKNSKGKKSTKKEETQKADNQKVADQYGVEYIDGDSVIFRVDQSMNISAKPHTIVNGESVTFAGKCDGDLVWQLGDNYARTLSGLNPPPQRFYAQFEAQKYIITGTCTAADGSSKVAKITITVNPGTPSVSDPNQNPNQN